MYAVRNEDGYPYHHHPYTGDRTLGVVPGENLKRRDARSGIRMCEVTGRSKAVP